MEVDELFVKLGLIPDKESFEEGSELIKKVKEGLEYFAGFEAVKGLGELVEHTVEAAVENKHLAERLGTSIEFVQQLGYAADVTGSSVTELRTGLQHLTLGLDHAKKTGTGPMVEGLRKLHLSLNDPTIKGNDLDAKLMKIADGFKEAGPGVDKTAAAMEIFGTRIGPKLLPLLNKGSDGIKELREEFVALGAQTSGETAEALEKLEEDQKKLKYAWSGIKDELVVGLVPALKEMLEGLLKWVMANREIIASTIKGVIEGLILAFKVLGTVVSVVADVMEFLKDNADLGRAALYALGTVIVAVAGSAAIAWVAGFGPIIGVVALVAGLIYVLQKLWEAAEEGSPLAAAAIAGIGIALAGVALTILSVMLPAIGSLIAAGFATTMAWFGVVAPFLVIAAAVAAVVFVVMGLKEEFGDLVMAIGGGAIALGLALGVAFWPLMLAAAAIITLHKYWDEITGAIPDLTTAEGREAFQKNADKGDAADSEASVADKGDAADSEASMFEHGGGNPALSPKADAMTGAGGDMHTNVDVGGIKVYGAPGMNEVDIADLVLEKINGVVRDAHHGTGGQ